MQALIQYRRLAEKHWREHCPKMVRELERKGMLQRMLLLKTNSNPFVPHALGGGQSCMEPEIQYPVGRRIRDVRKHLRITQEELAAWLNALRVPITRSIIANWETGRGDVPAHCIQLIAYSLRVKVTDILPDLTFKGVIAGQFMRPPGSHRRDRLKNKVSTNTVQ